MAKHSISHNMKEEAWQTKECKKWSQWNGSIDTYWAGLNLQHSSSSRKNKNLSFGLSSLLQDKKQLTINNCCCIAGIMAGLLLRLLQQQELKDKTHPSAITHWDKGVFMDFFSKCNISFQSNCQLCICPGEMRFSFVTLTTSWLSSSLLGGVFLPPYLNVFIKFISHVAAAP